MPAPKRGPRLGAGPKHQKLLLAQQAGQLFRHGRIRTTETKAKTLRPYAERLITKAKQGDLHARRQVLSKLRDRDVVAYLFEDVAPRFADRNGGYTRMLKLGPRPGDNAPMAIVELVDMGEVSGEDAIEESRQQRSRGLFGRRRRKAAPAQDDALDLDGFEDEDVEEPEATDEPDEAEEPATGTEDVDEDAGLDAQVPDEGPAQAPETPLDEAKTSKPVGPEDDPDAAKSTGKDAGGT